MRSTKMKNYQIASYKIYNIKYFTYYLKETVLEMSVR